MFLKDTRVKPISLLGIAFAITVLSFNNCSQRNFTPTESTLSSSSSLSASNSTNPAPAAGSVITALTGSLSSNLDSVSNSGLAYGYAVDPTQKTKVMKVFFYIDGAVGLGTLIGEAYANGGTVGSNAGHYFSFKIPAAYADGKSHKLYAYGFEAKAANLILSSPKTFTAYTPKAEAYFNAQIKPSVDSSCARCHGDAVSYTNLLYGQLLNPGPMSGGSATNNGFYNKINGGHQGNSCSNMPCAAIQAWWTAEFK